MKNQQRTFGRVALIVGASLSGAALTLVVPGLIFDNADASFVLLLLASILGIQGAAWLIIGVCFWYYFKSLADIFNRLKREGLCYDAEILQIVPTTFTYQIGRSVSVYAECSYINHDYKICLVKSNLFWSAYNLNIEDLTAKVYVNKSDPRDYAVDIQFKAQANTQYHYDYR